MNELLVLIEALGNAITPDNLEKAAALIEKLVTLAETIKQDISQSANTPSKS